MSIELLVALYVIFLIPICVALMFWGMSLWSAGSLAKTIGLPSGMSYIWGTLLLVIGVIGIVGPIIGMVKVSKSNKKELEEIRSHEEKIATINSSNKQTYPGSIDEL